MQAAFEKLFEEIDTDKSGSISYRELMVFCKNKGLKLGYGEMLAFMEYFDQVKKLMATLRLD
jgi:Ca2+-binding EF-hand superfamily protein